MFLKKLTLLQFKSYEEQSFEFSERINFILGNNGTGKTNILEAIYFLCLTKSFSGLSDTQLIKHEAQFFLLNAWIDDLALVSSMKEGHRKQLTINKQAYEKLSEHIGKFPVVFVSPNDHDFIRDASDSRRKLLDELFCQVSKEYLSHLQEFNKILKQRNQLLKQFKEKNFFDFDLLQVYTEQMCTHHVFIANFRKQNLEILSVKTQNYYIKLSNNHEKIALNYNSQETFSEEDFLKAAQNSLEKDRILQRSNIGCHKDDYEFLIDEFPLKKYGSQGQQKSFMLSLQLAKYEFLMDKSNKKPFLLLDDVFDKLDINRVHSLLKIVSSDDFGQIFITDASKDRTIGFTQDITCDYKLLEIRS